MNNYINAKKQIAATRNFLKEKKRTKFQNYCSELNRESNLKDVWGTFRKFSHIQNNNNSAQQPSSDMEVKILERLTPTNIDPDFTLKTDTKNSMRITMKDLESCLKKRIQRLVWMRCHTL